MLMKKLKLKEKSLHKMSKVKITLQRSLIGQGHNSRETIKSLGLKKIDSSVERDMDDSLQGMLRVVNHLVSIEEV